MRLGLSSAAAPDATLDELLAACRRRRIGALELVEGHGHALGPTTSAEAIAAAVSAASGAGIEIAAYRSSDPGRLMDPATARLASALSAPVVVAVAPESARPLIAGAAPRFADVGVMLLLVSGGELAEIEGLRQLAEAAPAGTIGIAWEIVPGRSALTAPEAVLEAGGGFIRHIRLHGGGPESVGQTGLGIGKLMSALALAGYTGTLAITPSTPRFHHAWNSWLGRRGGWGCGSKVGSDDVTTIER